MSEKKIDYHEHDTPPQEEFPDISSVASWSECTGLMYRTPADSAEWESLQQLSPMGIPRVEKEMEGTVLERLRKAEDVQETGEAVKSASGEYSSGQDTTYTPRHMKDDRQKPGVE